MKPLGQISYPDKVAAVTEAINILKAQMLQLGDLSLVASVKTGDGYQPDPTVFNYNAKGPIWIDYTPDLVPDHMDELEAGQAVAVSFVLDNHILASSGLEYALMFPWTISIYTGPNPAGTMDDYLYVAAPIPSTFIRLFMRSSDDFHMFEKIAKMYHQRIRETVRSAFFTVPGWKTDINLGIGEMSESTISQLEQMFGPLTVDTVGPVADVGAASPANTVDSVVDKICESIITGAHVAENAAVQEAFLKYLKGEMPWAELYNTMNYLGFTAAWPNESTILPWTGVRVLDFSDKSVGKLKLIEMCQAFYGPTALSVGIHHGPALPATYAVWEEGGHVKVKLLDPLFFFPYFFYDVMGDLPPLLAQAFGLFPFIIYNEMAVMANRALGDYFELRQFP